MNDTPAPLRRSARRLRLVALFALAVVELVILFAAWVLLAGRRDDFAMLTVHDQGMAPLPAAIVLLLFGLLIGLALLRLVAMLRQVEAGVRFPARALRGFATWLFLAVLFSVLAPLASVLTGGPIVLSLSGGEALMLLVTGLLFFVARLLGEAQALADDHSQIV
jgi:hypothetical protein